MDDIALAAGVAKGSVYYNFGSKGEMFEEIIKDGVRGLTADLRSAIEGHEGGRATPKPRYDDPRGRDRRKLR